MVQLQLRVCLPCEEACQHQQSRTETAKGRLIETRNGSDEQDLAMVCPSSSNRGDLQNRRGAECTPFTRPSLAFPCRKRSPGGGESIAGFTTRDRCSELVFAR